MRIKSDTIIAGLDRKSKSIRCKLSLYKRLARVGVWGSQQIFVVASDCGLRFSAWIFIRAKIRVRGEKEHENEFPVGNRWIGKENLRSWAGYDSWSG